MSEVDRLVCAYPEKEDAKEEEVKPNRDEKRMMHILLMLGWNPEDESEVALY